MRGEVSWFEVMGRNPEALYAFYGELFGWKLEPIEGMPYRATPRDWKALPGGIGQAPDGVGWLTFYVKVDDVEAAVARAIAMGGTVKMPPMTLPDGVTVAVVTDPEGHPVGLSKSAA